MSEADAETHKPKGFTCAEAAIELDMCVSRARIEIGKAIQGGFVKYVGRRRSVSIDGKPTLIPEYVAVWNNTAEVRPKRLRRK